MTGSKWSTPEHGSSSLPLTEDAVATIIAPLRYADGLLARWLLTVTSWGVHLHFDLPAGDGELWARAWEVGLLELALEMEKRADSVRSTIHSVARQRAGGDT